MSTIAVIVTIDTFEHSFMETALQARAVIENILRRDPRYTLNHMTVNLQPEAVHQRDTRAEDAGDNLCNIFEQNNPHRDGPQTKHIHRGGL